MYSSAYSPTDIQPRLTVEYRRPIAAIVGSYSDATSIATYGTHAKTIIERSILTVEEANLRAEYEVAQNANPAVSLSMQWTQDGIALGDSVPVTLAAAGISGSYLCRSLKLSWRSPSETLYEAELGQVRPNLISIIRKLGSFAQRQAI